MKKSLSKRTTLLSRIWQYRASYVLMLPFTLLFVTFVVLPVVVSIGLGFTYYNVFQDPIFVGLENYTRLFFEDDIFMTSIQNTLVFAVVTGPISYLMCLFFAWMINDLPRGIRACLTLLFYTPSLVGGVAIWKLILSGDQYGVVNSILMSLNITNDPIRWFTDSSTMKIAIIVIVLWQSLGVNFLSFVAGFQNVDRTLYEAGAIDGIRNRWQELWYITLPSLKGQLMFGAIISITASFGIGEVITTYCGFPSSNYGAHTIMNHLQDYGSIRFEMGYACAIATILFMIMMLLNQLIQRLIAKVGQ